MSYSSTINPTIPVTSSSGSSAVMRAQFAAAITDINYLGANYAPLTSPALTTPSIAGSSTGVTTIASANASATSYTLTLPAITDTFATLTATQTLTNKTLTSAFLDGINGGQLAGLRNRIINGDMRIDQRNAGNSQSVTSAYTVDRWIGAATGAAVTGQRVAGTGSDQYSYQITGAASNTNVQFQQPIESTNIYDLASKTVTLQAKLSASALTTVTWKAYYANSVDNFSATTLINSGTFTITSTPTVYSTQIALPANAINGVDIIFNFGAMTSGTANITDVQLEQGSIATPFERRPIGLDLALCQRYYQKSYSQSVAPGTASNGDEPAFYSINSSDFYDLGKQSLKMPMRAPPTMAGYNPVSGVAGTFYNYNISSAQGNIGASNISDNAFRLYCSNASMTANNTFGAHWTASAEL